MTARLVRTEIEVPACWFVTAWEPPRRFAYEEREWAERAPPWATEILVGSRDGTCLVRLVSDVFSGGEDWGDEIDDAEAGWRLGMENLRLYLTHFAGEPHERAWPAVASALGVQGVRVPGPVVSGVIEVYAHPGDGKTHLAMRAYRLGDDAAAVAAREEPAWRAWMGEHV